jgi:hypothetical protein
MTGKAPALKELAQKCETADFSMVAVVEWFPGDTSATMTVRANSSAKMKVALYAAQARDNVDALIMKLISYAQMNGHNSIYLQKLGVDGAGRR